MGLAVHVFRRNAVYVWRRRLPTTVNTAGSIQISLRTRDPQIARSIAPVVTARSGEIFCGITEGRLTPTEARGAFEALVSDQIDRFCLSITKHDRVIERNCLGACVREGSPGQSLDVITKPPAPSCPEAQRSPAEPSASEVHPASPILSIVDRVIDQMRDEGTGIGQQNQIRQTAALFIELAGVRDIASIRQPHLSRFADLLRKMPKSYGKSTKDRSRPLADIIAEAAALPAEKRGLSAPTINRHLGIIERLVKRAGSEGVAVDPFLDFDALRRRDTRRARDKRGSLSLDDVQRIFRHPVFTGCKSVRQRRTKGPEIIQDALYWLPLLAAYTGARREELAAMEARDVAHEDGIWILHLRPNANRAQMKNATSERRVPIHSAIIAHGFLDYARSVHQDGNLFPELKRKHANAGLGESAAYMIEKVLTDQLGDERRGKSFHSFRHYVTDQLRNTAGIPKHVRMDLLGHSGEDIEDEVYGSTSALSALREAVESLPTISFTPARGQAQCNTAGTPINQTS